MSCVQVCSSVIRGVQNTHDVTFQKIVKLGQAPRCSYGTLQNRRESPFGRPNPGLGHLSYTLSPKSICGCPKLKFKQTKIWSWPNTRPVVPSLRMRCPNLRFGCPNRKTRNIKYYILAKRKVYMLSHGPETRTGGGYWTRQTLVFSLRFHEKAISNLCIHYTRPIKAKAAWEK